MTRRFSSVVFSAGLFMAAALASAQVDASSREAAVDKVACELSDPLAPVTTFSTNLRAYFGNGPDDDTNYQWNVQPSFFAPLSGGKALLLRTILPVNWTSFPGHNSGSATSNSSRTTCLT